MPELPDVDVFRGYLGATSLHHPIRDVDVNNSDVLVDCSAAALRRALRDVSLEQPRRHGKQLGVQLSSGRWLMLHFGMTGYPDYARDDGPPPAHTRVALYFDNGYRLAYVNQRKLGRVGLADDFDAFIARAELGPDALDIERDAFVALLSGGQGTLKSRLMNQQIIAGLGNVYTDEIFFQARRHPATPLDDVDENTAAELWRTMRRVLRTAIDRHAEPREFPDSWLTRHRDDAQCPRCGAPIEHVKISGRTSRLCPACQPAPKNR